MHIAHAVLVFQLRPEPSRSESVALILLSFDLHPIARQDVPVLAFMAWPDHAALCITSHSNRPFAMLHWMASQSYLWTKNDDSTELPPHPRIETQTKSPQRARGADQRAHRPGPPPQEIRGTTSKAPFFGRRWLRRGWSVLGSCGPCAKGWLLVSAKVPPSRGKGRAANIVSNSDGWGYFRGPREQRKRTAWCIAASHPAEGACKRWGCCETPRVMAPAMETFWSPRRDLATEGPWPPR